MLSIEDVMGTALLSVRDSDTLAEAQARMTAAGIRHLPVADEKNHVVGILSNRDLAGAGRGKNRRVGEVMSRDVKTVRADEPASRALELMLDHKFGSLPVVGADETLIGIVTETDFLRIAWEVLRGQSEAGTNHSAGPELP